MTALKFTSNQSQNSDVADTTVGFYTDVLRRHNGVSKAPYCHRSSRIIESIVLFKYRLKSTADGSKSDAPLTSQSGRQDVTVYSVTTDRPWDSDAPWDKHFFRAQFLFYCLFLMNDHFNSTPTCARKIL